jgi:hypothetical protein
MKKTILSRALKTTATIFCGILIMSTSYSCKKDASSSTATTDTVSETEASQAITQAVVPTSGGMAEQTANAAIVANDQIAYPCSQSFDSSILLTNTAGASITYSADLEWNWILNCSAANFTFAFKGHTTYSAPLMSSNDSTTAWFIITGLQESSTAYVLNSNYVRNGSQQSNIGNRNSFTSLITITSSNINIDKISEQIISGTATVSISGASTSGRSFSFSGNINFLGNQAATLTMASGNVYQINW